MTDIEVLEREMQCVRRKARINCTNCGSCDLLMDDMRILTAYANAIAALSAQQETEKDDREAVQGMCCDCIMDGPCCDYSENPDCPYHKEDGSCWTAFHEPQEEKNEPLTLEELREMDGQPVLIVWLDEGDFYWVVVHGITASVISVDDGGWVELNDYGKTWLAYRRPPGATAQ